MKKIYLFILLLILFIACNPILKVLTGISDMKLVEVGEMKSFCIKNNIPLNEVYYVVSRTKWDYPDSTQINLQFVDELLVFDKDGNRLLYRGEQTGYYCSLPSKDFFSTLNTMFLEVDTVYNLNFFLTNINNLETIKKPEIEKADYYLVYYWALWYSKSSKRSIQEIKQIISDTSVGKKVQIFYINNDYVKENYPEDIAFKKEKVSIHFKNQP